MHTLREKALIFLAHKIGLPYFKLVRRKPDFPYDSKDLQNMPVNSVGRHLAAFFEKNNLQLLPFYEKHDIKHVVLGYDATEEGEICLQCFMLANGRITIPVVIAVLFGCLTMPEYYGKFKSAWQNGRRTPSLQGLTWFALLRSDLQTVRAGLNIHQFKNK